MTRDRFFEDAADVLHLLHADWKRAAASQAALADAALGSLPARPRSVLDAACGIGLLTLGLARLGYDVTGCEASQRALDRARQLARETRAAPEYRQVSLRRLAPSLNRRFGAVLLWDDCLSYLADEAQVRGAIRDARQCLSQGGALLVQHARSPSASGVSARTIGVRQGGGSRWTIVEVLEARGDHEHRDLYFLEDSGHATRAVVGRVRTLALGVERSEQLLREGGFSAVRRVTGEGPGTILVCHD